ncbi:PREDICTED: uncharacterized protein LOC108370801 [Rhagoletis zephyria]|uniref:uncharacterized protein LOC108370801 n=1 Tax=Rhagoletis zephyria TaxID=28612 RepID=UPI0008112E56|nr:PREDICTED: uncharacterized protein LOC108370801 [Rhagoletis zephyria]
MSNFNYIDRVPVKIAENFKPPPRLYQLPLVIVHKLQLPANHYNDAPQYSYDFQLERKVLTKMPEWRRMRQLEREARRDRKERREREKLHELESKNKQMLGAVSYPSADDLSSSDSDSEEQKDDKQINVANSPDLEQTSVLRTQISSFHNILQPTILSIGDEKFQIPNGLSVEGLQSHPKNGKYSGGSKEVNAFNYKDFEEDTSSPFDNIELKTINDLDILAQVLHNTQLHTQKNPIKDELSEKSPEEEPKEIEVDSIKSQLESKENTRNTNVYKIISNSKDNLPQDRDFEGLENNKTSLQRVSFENYGQQGWCDVNIPNAIITNNSITSTANFIGNHCNISTCTSFAPSNQQESTQQQSYSMAYGTLYNSHVEPQLSQHYTNLNVHSTHCTPATSGNQNYFYAPAYNGISSEYCSPRHMQQHSTNVNSTYLSSNINNYGSSTSVSNGIHLQQHQQLQPTNEYNELNSKSKSVPDILKELSDEVRNSEIRRSRYYSFNSEEGKQNDEKQDVDEDITPKQSPVKVPKSSHDTNYYAELSPAAQRLVKNISSMGFPLQRVAKISQVFGTDDKKIVEHLIPLSELMDLGFDEAKISEALIKFDNNKEKALEYLIS